MKVDSPFCENSDKFGLKSYVYGKEIIVDERLMHRVFKIHNKGPRMFAHKDSPSLESFYKSGAICRITSLDARFPHFAMHANLLLPLPKILHHVIFHTILRKIGHKDWVSNLDSSFG